MPGYSVASAAAVTGVVMLELLVLRTGMFRDPRYWITLAVLVAFQLLADGLLTGLPVVRYAPGQLLGPRVAYEPIEDLGFGFALVTATIGLWRRYGMRRRGG